MAASGQVYCILLFITGASVFGLLISHFNETMEAESRENRKMEDVMDPYLSIRPKSRPPHPMGALLTPLLCLP